MQALGFMITTTYVLIDQANKQSIKILIFFTTLVPILGNRKSSKKNNLFMRSRISTIVICMESLSYTL